MKRKKWIDVAKGIGILMIIVGHCWPLIRSFLYAVHVPLFFVISGYLFKEKKATDLAKKNSKSLLMPYAITSAILIATSYINNHFSIPKMYSMGPTKQVILSVFYGIGDVTVIPLLHKEIHFIGAIWFLLAMFFANQFFNWSLKRAKGSLTKIFMLSLAFCVVGFMISRVFLLPFSINSAMIAQLFYWFGYVLKRKEFKFSHVVFLVIGGYLWLMSALSGIFYVVNGHANYYLLAVLGAFGGSYVIMFLSTKITKIRGFNFLSWIGRNSLIALCVHLVDLNALTLGGEILLNYNLFLLIIYRVSFVMICVYLINKLKPRKVTR